MSIQLTLPREDENYEPGEALEGVVEWSLSREVESLEVRLIWHTAGKGDRDWAQVDQRLIDHPAMSGSQPFSFMLPIAPYTYFGKMVSILWAIEVVTNPETDALSHPIIMGPGGFAVDLGGIRGGEVDKDDEEEEPSEEGKS